MLKRFFQQYTGWLRSFKGAYMVNNLIHADQLWHNRTLYRKRGLSKRFFDPIGFRDFKKHPAPTVLPWLDQPDAMAQIEQHEAFRSFDSGIQNQIRQFVRDGYLVIEGFFSPSDTDALNAEVDQLLRTGKAGFNFTGRKVFNLHEISALANDHFFRNREILSLLKFLLGREVVPFQSLNFTLGSEQRVHSDSIHMTTDPPGYLIATWIALEPCTPDNGPLVYYPGSHRLPFVSTDDYDSGNTALTIGEHSNKRYEDKIAQLIQEHNLTPQYFLANRGDVLIWHANLLHGGSPIKGPVPGTTRRSMVCHYFGKDVICYHELSQRPALMPKRK
jgi:ectoine hydroxylase